MYTVDIEPLKTELIFSKKYPKPSSLDNLINTIGMNKLSKFEGLAHVLLNLY